LVRRSAIVIIKLVEDSDKTGSLRVPPTDTEREPSPDAPVIRGLRGNDSRVLQKLMEDYWPSLVAFAQRTLSGAADPEDMVQTAFVRLWSRRESLHEKGSVKALLYTIVRNACLDELRKKTRRDRAEEDARPPAQPRTPYEDVHGAELQRVAAAAVARLPERRREVFRLVREEGFSYREVAELMELSTQTVANHMSLAMADLRTALRPFFAEEKGGVEEGETAQNGGSTDG
jgi:RNA polymerase sigma-70 factor (ECF subfamily)